jgi:[protein-PII] uridylyltransferase
MSRVDRLNMLLLLTYADHCGVGPGIWNEWKGSLLWDLYTRTRARLTEANPVDEAAPESARDTASRQLHAEFPGSEVERHFALMPERYLRVTGAGEMVRHFRLVQAREDEPLAAEWHPGDHCTQLVVVTRDHPGLLAQMAGTLTAHGLDILSVDLYTREDSVVVDVFKLREAREHGPVAAARRPAIENALRSAVKGDYDVARAVERWRRGWRRRSKPPLVRPAVRFDSISSVLSSVIEVRAEDEPGLVFRIASVLSAHGLNISFAKIATEKSHALDVFYVTGARGGKLDEEEMHRVEASLTTALDPQRAAQS